MLSSVTVVLSTQKHELNKFLLFINYPWCSAVAAQNKVREQPCSGLCSQQVQGHGWVSFAHNHVCPQIWCHSSISISESLGSSSGPLLRQSRRCLFLVFPFAPSLSALHTPSQRISAEHEAGVHSAPPALLPRTPPLPAIPGFRSSWKVQSLEWVCGSKTFCSSLNWHSRLVPLRRNTFKPNECSTGFFCRNLFSQKSPQYMKME